MRLACRHYQWNGGERLIMDLSIDTRDLTKAIGQLERFEERIPFALSRATDPKRWVDRARKRANEVMSELAENGEEQALVPKLAGQITAAFWGGGGDGGGAGTAGSFGMVWKLDVPEEGLDVGSTLRSEATGDLFRGSNIQNLNRLQEYLLDWVRLEKNKDQRDAGLTDEQIARRILHILIGTGPKQNEARDKLMPHIQAFIDQQAKETLGDSKLARWLNAILDAWADLALEEVSEAVEDEIAAEWRKQT